MPTREQLLLSAALLGAAFSSSALLSCKSADVSAEPLPAATATAAPAPLDPNDPESLRRAAAVVATWNQKDPALTAKILKENGIVVTDPATFQAMADAQAAASAAASASASVAVAATAPRPRPTAAPQPPPPSRVVAPMA
jgi:hypothetical protein